VCITVISPLSTADTYHHNSRYSAVSHSVFQQKRKDALFFAKDKAPEQKQHHIIVDARAESRDKVARPHAALSQAQLTILSFKFNEAGSRAREGEQGDERRTEHAAQTSTTNFLAPGEEIESS
jgi:hypothetical protein